jgi:drug/metabolite transporter (DMT)-like permease
LASFFWGVSYTLFKYPIAWLGILRFSFLLEFRVSMLVGVLLWRSKDSLRSLEQGPIRFLAICLIGGSVFLHLSYQLTDFTKIIFAGKFQLIFSIIAAKVLYGESIGWYRLAGIGFLFLSIFLIF